MTKMMLQKWCWRSATKDGATEAVLKRCYRNVATKDVAEAMLQKMLLQKITCSFVLNKCTSAIFFSCRRWQQASRLVVISWFYSLVVDDDDEPISRLLVIVGCFSLVTKDDNKLYGLLSFFGFFSLVVEDNKPRGSLSSLGFFLRCKKWQRVGISARCHPWLFFFNYKRQKWAFYRCRIN